MSYSIDLEQALLLCWTEERARKVVKLVSSHPWMKSKMRLSVSPSGMAQGAPQWQAFVDEFDGGAWSNDLAAQVWLSLVPHLANRSWMIIRTEQGERFRYRWEYGRVHHDEPVLTIWREYSLLGPFAKLEDPEVLPAPPQTPAPRTPKGKREARAKRKP